MANEFKDGANQQLTEALDVIKAIELRTPELHNISNPGTHSRGGETK